MTVATEFATTPVSWSTDKEHLDDDATRQFVEIIARRGQNSSNFRHYLGASDGAIRYFSGSLDTKTATPSQYRQVGGAFLRLRM